MFQNSAFTRINQIFDYLDGSKNASQVALAHYQRYQNALITIRCIRKTLPNLEALILAGTEAVKSFSALLGAFPPNNLNFRYMKSELVTMEMQLKVWITLREYQTPQGKQKLYHLLKHRFEDRNGIQLTHLCPGHTMESLDPLRRSNIYNEKDLITWLNALGDEDPCEHIVQFLFDFDAKERDYLHSATMSSDDRASCRIVASKGSLQAYHVQTPDQPPTRYIPYLHEKWLAISTIHRLPLNTVGGGASRGGGDFVGGDPYVLSPSGEMHSLNFNGTIHSQFLDREAVQGAGLWVVRNGKVLLIDNRSGHYMPNWRGLLQSVQWIAERDGFHPEAVVGYVFSSRDVMFFKVQDYLKLGKAEFPYEATLEVVRGYHRRYKGRLPVPKSFETHIPANYRTDWADGKKDRWDQWLKGVFPVMHSSPLIPEPKPSAPLSKTSSPERRFGGMA